MSITHNQTVARGAAAVAGLALVLSGFAPVAAAQTATSHSTTTTSATAPFMRDLTVGSTGADVIALQTWLIGRGFTIPAGATGYFGGQTQAAVARFQAANAIVPAAGYFGPLTRGKVNAMLNTGTTPPPSNGGGNNNGGLSGSAGDLRDADFISSLNNEQVGENSDGEVLGLSLEADKGSDLRLMSARVTFTLAAGTGSDDFDDYADSIVLSLDGDEIGDMDVDDMTHKNGVWTANVSLDKGAIIRRDDSADLTVTVNALRNIDSDDLGNNTWAAKVTNLRYQDAQGAIVTETSLGDIGDARNFSFASFTSANDVELTLRKGNDSPDAGTVAVDEDGDDEVTLLTGNLKADGSDIDLTKLGFTAMVNGAGTTTTDIANVVTEFRLLIDGDVVDTIDADECAVTANCDNGDGDNAASYVFDDIEGVTVGEGDTVEFEIVAVTSEIDSVIFPEGTSLSVSVDDDQIEAEVDRDELSTPEINGAAVGEEITLRSTGLGVELNDSKSGASASTNVGTFTFVVNATAFGDDVELTKGDFDYTVTRAPATATYSESTILKASKNITERAGTFTVDENEDGTFTFTVYVAIDGSEDTGVYEVRLNSVGGSAVNESLSTFIAYRS